MTKAQAEQIVATKSQYLLRVLKCACPGGYAVVGPLAGRAGFEVLITVNEPSVIGQIFPMMRVQRAGNGEQRPLTRLW